RACDARAFRLGAQFCPLNGGMNAARHGRLREAAIRARHHALAADDFGEADQTLGDEFGMLYDVGDVADDAGNEHAVLGNLHVLPDSPFVLVPHIAGFELIRAHAQLQQQIDDVFQRYVVRMRRVPASPADVIADAILRQAFDGMIDRFYPQLGPFAIIAQGHGRHEALVSVRKKRVVNLHAQPGVQNSFVFFAAGFGQRPEQRLIVGIIFVLVNGERAARRNYGQEAIDYVDLCERGFEVRDVALDLRVADIADGRVADSCNRGAADLKALGGEIFGVELREILEITAAAHRDQRIFLLFRCGRAFGEASDALVNVEGPIAGLAVFAVADDVHSRFGLTADDAGDGIGEAGRERGFVVILALFDFLEIWEQFGRTNQAADVSGQDSVGSRGHDATSYLASNSSMFRPFGSWTKMFRTLGANCTTFPSLDSTFTPAVRMRSRRPSRSVTRKAMAGAPGSGTRRWKGWRWIPSYS